MKKHKTIDVVQAHEGAASRAEVTVVGARDAARKRKAELRRSIEASTARLVRIAMTRDSDPEAA